MFFFPFAVVFLLFGDPVCLWGGCSDLGLHEQGHSEWPWFLFPLDVFSLFLLLMCPQISKELINFYDSAYIKAVDVSGSPSKDAAIKVLDVFHNTVCDVDPSQTAKSFFFSRQPSDHLFFSIFQLDCCGKGDDTALFKQVAGTLCPRKSPDDFHKSQVSSKHTLRNLGIKLQGALGVLAASALCAGPVFIYFLLSPSRAVMLNSSSCSLRSSTWLVWLLWWSPSSWWVSHLSDEDLGLRAADHSNHSPVLTCADLWDDLHHGAVLWNP